MKTPDLKECREKLDGIDREIVRLFEERMVVCGQVAEYKIETGKAVYDGEREKQKLAAVREMAAGDQNKEAVEELFTQLMTMSRRYQYSLLCARKKTPPLGFTEVEEIRKKDVRVVFQGVEGAYSHAAVRMYFGEDADAYHVENSRTRSGSWRGGRRIMQCFPLKTPPPASLSPTMTCYPDMTIISWERSMCLWTMCS